MDYLVSSGLNTQEAHQLWERMEYILKNGLREEQSLLQIEDNLRELYHSSKVDPRETYTHLIHRAERCYELISKYLMGETILDFGAGSGLLSRVIQTRKRMKVSLVDVVNYSLVPLPFYNYDPQGKLDFDDNFFDSSLLYLVLHHADEPFKALKEVARVTKQRLIIVEGEIEQPERYLVNCFLDWIHNRIFSGVNIPVPLNFLRVEDWCRWFDELDLKLVKTQMLGIDDPLAPEFHVLYILDK